MNGKKVALVKLNPPIILVLLLLSISGCANPYKVPTSASTAEFSIEAYNDSKNITARFLIVRALSNKDKDSCEPHPNGEQVGSDTGLPYHNRNFASIPPVHILTSEPFRFLAQHSESRYKETGYCVVSAYFQPIKGKKYKAILDVKNNASYCDINIFDITDGNKQLIEFVQPDFLCGSNPAPNGKGFSQRLMY